MTKQQQRIFTTTFFTVFGFIILLFGVLWTIGLSQTHSNLIPGILIIIAGIGNLLYPPIAYVYTYTKNKNAAKAYETWLSSKNYTYANIIGGTKVPAIEHENGFVIDAEQKRWGKYTKRFLLNTSSIVSVDIKTNGATISQSTEFIRGKTKLNNSHANTNAVSFGTAESKDNSTYDVYIQTSVPQLPTVNIPCEHDYNAAQTICGLIRIWLSKNEPQKPEPQSVTTENTYTASNEGNISEILRNYKKLLDEGLITEEEFAQKKRQILHI